MADLYSIHYSTRTEACDRTKIVNVMWTIPNFTLYFESQTTRELRTCIADFANSPDNDIKFQMKMQFVGRENDLIEICYLAPVTMFLKCILTICLRCYKERSIVMKEYQMIQPNKWQFLGALLKRDILSHDGCDTYLNEGSLNLKFQFMINKEIKANNNSVSKAQLSHDLKNLFLDAVFADVIIKSTEGVEFKTHKAVLAARSAVFRAHFKHNTVESLTNIIEFPFETEVLQEVLTYIYTDNAPKLCDIPEKLLAAADFYQMSRLKYLCEEALQQKLTVDNVIETLELAELHSATQLKKMALEFINDGHASLITKTKSWARLQSVALIKTIFEYTLNNGQLEEDLR